MVREVVLEYAWAVGLVAAVVAGGILWVYVFDRFLHRCFRHFSTVWLNFREEEFSGSIVGSKFADYVCEGGNERLSSLLEFLWAVRGLERKGQARSWQRMWFIDVVMEDLAGELKKMEGEEAAARLMEASKKVLGRHTLVESK